MKITKEANIGSYLGVPIVLEDGTMYGTLCALDPDATHFKPEQVRIMEIVAKQLALVIDLEKTVLEKELSEKKTEYMAFHDDLTNLPNRRYLDKQLEKLIIKASKADKQVALLIINLDRFKEVNDLGGYQFGDKILVQVSERLRDYCSNLSNAFLVDLGTDKFAVILSNIEDLSQSELTAKSILNLFNEHYVVQNLELYLSIRIGIAHYPIHGDTTQIIKKNAETAVYKAKDNYNLYEYYDYNQENEFYVSESFLQIATRLRRAIKNKEFSLHYQPKVNIKSNTIIGSEALLRWNDKEFGSIPPNRFIPVLEETGLIIETGYWVIREACRETKKTQKLTNKALSISVNVCIRQLMDDDFVDTVNNILNETKLLPEHLEIEITESLAMKHPKTILQRINDIVKLGCKISIDDFGTGYSSFSQVKQLPIQNIKIDRSFIIDIATDNNAKAIVTAIVAMAKELNKSIIVEGVETVSQLKEIRKLECEVVQGFYYSPPVPIMNYIKLIKNFN